MIKTGLHSGAAALHVQRKLARLREYIDLLKQRLPGHECVRASAPQQTLFHPSSSHLSQGSSHLLRSLPPRPLVKQKKNDDCKVLDSPRDWCLVLLALTYLCATHRCVAALPVH